MCFKVTSTDEQQQVIQMLVQMNSVKADDVLMKALQFQLISDENIAIRLDLLEAARKRGEKSLVEYCS